MHGTNAILPRLLGFVGTSTFPFFLHLPHLCSLFHFGSWPLTILPSQINSLSSITFPHYSHKWNTHKLLKNFFFNNYLCVDVKKKKTAKNIHWVNYSIIKVHDFTCAVQRFLFTPNLQTHLFIQLSWKSVVDTCVILPGNQARKPSRWKLFHRLLSSGYSLVVIIIFFLFFIFLVYVYVYLIYTPNEQTYWKIYNILHHTVLFEIICVSV